ncbi:penicillin acylase family protein, partial [Candidatus Sumerlaeota bacterium]|nr:penicillin acylase family protein [Candidatus Sumerlaeota bacterium]
CSIAMTTGSGDTADIFEETVNPVNPNQYQVDGKWLDMEIRREKIGVKKEDDSVDWVGVDIQYTKHGPIVARKNGKAYAMAIPYMDSTGSVEQIYEMMRAKNLEEMKRALARLDLMGQNVMIGTVDGDIYYQRTGKVPIRGKGVDPTKPIPGENSSNDWKGIHKAEELVQVTNPPQGYMQNCNVSPFAMMKNSPMRLKDYPAYIYGAEETPPHQRAAMVVETLDKEERVTLDEALALAVNHQVYNADKWQQRLIQAWPKQGNHGAEATKLFELIRGWDGRSAPESTGALAYKYWKDALPETARDGDKMGDPPPASLTDAEMIAAANSASAKMMKDFGRMDVPYGEVYRCGRINADGSYSTTYPVGGGKPGSGIATPRAIGFVKPAP